MVADKQTDVLRTNKVIREVSRALGADWGPVFERLTCVLPPEAVSEAMKKIESARSFMQVSARAQSSAQHIVPLQCRS